MLFFNDVYYSVNGIFYLEDYFILSHVVSYLVFVLMQYYESRLLVEDKEETEEISAAVEKALSIKIQKLEAKIEKCMEEKRFLDEVST